MLIDINSCTWQQLNTALAVLNVHQDYVFWIRNDQMTKQIYVSPSFESIWGHEINIIFSAPLIWFDYLNPDEKVNAMQQFSARHEAKYLDDEKNLIHYQIRNKHGDLIFIRDRCFRMKDHQDSQYIVGVSKAVQGEIWYPDRDDQTIYDYFITVLKSHFGLQLIGSQDDFSKRELECLYFLCKGQTYKEIGRAMNISPRTVETHVERMRIKAECHSKIQLVAKCSGYFN